MLRILTWAGRAAGGAAAAAMMQAKQMARPNPVVPEIMELRGATGLLGAALRLVLALLRFFIVRGSGW